MEAWVWLLVYLAGFGLLQLFLYRYLRNSQGRSGRTAPAGADGEGLGARLEARPTEADWHDRTGESEGLYCPHCGAHNEPDYTYCRNCVAQV